MLSGNAPASRKQRYRLVARRWSAMLLAVGLFIVVAGEIAGGRWPIVLVTPLARQAAVAITVGLAALIWVTDRRSRTRTIVWLVAGVIGGYAWFVALGWQPRRIVPTAPYVSATDANFGRIKILSANIHSPNSDYPKVLKLIRREDPDVVLLMELTTPWVAALAPLSEKYPHHDVAADDAGNFGIGVWTRLPADSLRLVVHQHGQTPSLDDVANAEAVLCLSEYRQIRFIGVHPLPPLTPRMAAARDDLLRAIALDVAKGDVPTIVAGDLNATKYCRITRDMATIASLRDAMATIPFSWPNTAGKYVAGIRLDQVLVTNQWRVVEAHAGEDMGSDHLPMVVTLQLAQE